VVESEPRGRRERVFGRHAVAAVLAERPHAVVSAMLLAGRPSGGLATIEAELERLGVPIVRVRRAALDQATGRGVHQGIMLEIQSIGEFTLAEFEDLALRRIGGLQLLVLDGIEDPRNLGACLRTADAAGIDAVVVPKSRTTKLTAVAVKAAAGAAETVPVLRASNLVRTLKWLKAAGVRVVGADSGASTSLFDASLGTPLALVLGGEGRGIRRLTRETCDELVSIPMRGSVESLNVSVATGIVLYELVRQRRAHTDSADA
jgi:23S rRNA (guanosine2251-2'-O)-methyltransferase